MTIPHSESCACEDCYSFSLTEKAAIHGVKDVARHYRISLKESYDFLVKSGYIRSVK